MDGQLMAAEIKEQPQVLARILADGRPHIAAVGRAIRARAPRFVLFVARGTSDHAALYAKYLVETRLGLPAGLRQDSECNGTVAHVSPQSGRSDVAYAAFSTAHTSPHRSWNRRR